MGQKVNPVGFRLPVTKTWKSFWCAPRRKFAEYLHQDYLIRRRIVSDATLYRAGISEVCINRVHQSVVVTIHAVRPAFLIGKKGDLLEKLKKSISDMVKTTVVINFMEVKSPHLCPELVLQSIERQLKVPGTNYKAVARKHIQAAVGEGAKGVKLRFSGRLGDADIARSESWQEGSLPLHTLRANIDYVCGVSVGKYGSTGVKVWIYLDTSKGNNLSAK